MTANRLSIETWSALWRRLGARSDPRLPHQEITRAYSEPHRHYHTLEHIAHALTLFDGARASVRDADAAELALWLHDFVYDPRAKDNEARSAAYAARILHAGGLPSHVAERVTALIMVTRHLASPDDPDAQYVVDADLAICNEAERREGRTRVLRAFLDRPRIYLTREFLRFEGPARANLERSLRHLAAP
jgi:predicted metal-dependent HD superfamily phosphohydrolase